MATKTLKAKNKVITRPHITEKATLLQTASKPAYAFLVAPGASKTEIIKAIKAKYGVSPLKVTMINLPRKKTGGRRKPGLSAVKRKAIVHLPAGSTINLA